MTAPRPEQYVIGQAGVNIPPWVCDVLNREAGLDEFRVRVRGRSAELDAVLLAIRMLGLLSSRSGTRVAADREPPPVSDGWVSAKAAADLLGISKRGVLKAIEAGRLTAERQAGGRWQIRRTVVESYRKARRP